MTQQPEQNKMQWFREAKFGMFIHWGLYSILKRGEWVMHAENMPIKEYEKLAIHFKPEANFAREWASLAKRAGMRYVVFTTKHHDGFCLFNTKQTSFNSLNSAANIDCVKEVVKAFRTEGLYVGLYYSIGDWRHPEHRAMSSGKKIDANKIKKYAHNHIKELCSIYKPDLIWYDGAWYNEKIGFTPQTIKAEEMNNAARSLVPNIIINERAGVKADYVTCENIFQPAKFGEDWEMCTCINDIWGYCENDFNYKTVNQLIFLLVNCAAHGGNLLLNIGPKANGKVPYEQIKRLEEIGKWLKVNGEAIYGVERVTYPFFGYGRMTHKNNKLYLHTFYWPGNTVKIPFLADDVLKGEPGKVKLNAYLLATGKKLKTKWQNNSLVISKMPAEPPDKRDTVIVLEKV
jgi:alpha-L-fucosidase